MDAKRNARRAELIKKFAVETLSDEERKEFEELQEESLAEAECFFAFNGMDWSQIAALERRLKQGESEHEDSREADAG